MEKGSQVNGESSPTRVTGALSRAVVRMLSDQGVPANEVVVTAAQHNGNGETASWMVTVLRGRERASHPFPSDLVEKVLARGPCKEWYTEVGRLLEAAGMRFPA